MNRTAQVFRALVAPITMVIPTVALALCTVTVLPIQGQTSSPGFLCVSSPSPGMPAQMIVQAGATIDFSIACDTDLTAMSTVTVDLDTPGPLAEGAGFSDDDATFNNAIRGGDWQGASVSEPYTASGNTFYRRTTFNYQGPALSSQTYTLDTTLFKSRVPNESTTTAITLTINNGSDSGTSNAFDLNWNACLANPVSLFFPYIPALKRGSSLPLNTCVRTPGDWALLSYNNHGFLDVEDLVATIYEEDGSQWRVQFPVLPVRDQATWRLYDTGTEVLFENTRTGVVLPLVYVDGDTTALDSPATMFVSAGASVAFFSDVFGVDIDGFFQLGRDQSIHSSYLPRNYDNDIPNQNSNLPLMRK